MKQFICGHTYHEECIWQCLVAKPDSACPLCTL